MFLGKYHIPWWILHPAMFVDREGRVSRNSAARMCKIIWNFNPTQSHKVAARERVARGLKSRLVVSVGWTVFLLRVLFFPVLVVKKLTHLYGNSTGIYYIACSIHIYIYNIYIYLYRYSWFLCKLISWMFYFVCIFFWNEPSSWRNPISTINHFLIWDGNGVVVLYWRLDPIFASVCWYKSPPDRLCCKIGSLTLCFAGTCVLWISNDDNGQSTYFPPP